MKPAVIGAGNWGTAIANLLGKKNIRVKIWAHETEVVEGINQSKSNPLFLANATLSENISAYNDVNETVEGCNIIIMATPSQFYRQTLEKLVRVLPGNVPIISAVKGIEDNSLMLISQVTASVRKQPEGKQFAVLSGPTFAEEVAAGKPTAAVIASRDKNLAGDARKMFSTDYFRLYLNSDIIGVQLGGALKNIFAIASGIIAGLDLGLNTQAALISRGNAEMTRLAVKLGADPKTLSGLAGIGDLILTATGSLSRNRTLGMRLARGEKLEDIRSTTLTVAEGIRTTLAAFKLARKTKTDMPIVEALHGVLYESKSVHEAVKLLMGRPLKDEFGE
jgi:glycerol-3-phosphate dehydrogenase (NAD(P)+)